MKFSSFLVLYTSGSSLLWEDLEEEEEEPELVESSESYSMCSSVLIRSFCI